MLSRPWSLYMLASGEHQPPGGTAWRTHRLCPERKFTAFGVRPGAFASPAKMRDQKSICLSDTIRALPNHLRLASASSRSCRPSGNVLHVFLALCLLLNPSRTAGAVILRLLPYQRRLGLSCKSLDLIGRKKAFDTISVSADSTVPTARRLLNPIPLVTTRSRASLAITYDYRDLAGPGNSADPLSRTWLRTSHAGATNALGCPEI